LFFDPEDGGDMYLRNVGSGSKINPSMNPVLLAISFHAGLLVGLFFEPERGDEMLLLLFQWTTQCYSPENRTLLNYSYENLKSCIFSSFMELRT
jgi:hypothetical protein